MTMSLTAAYVQGVETAYQGEVYGEILYQGIADGRPDAGERQKWLVLVEMERVTRRHMAALVTLLGRSTAEDPYWAGRGREEIAKYAPLPWPELMRIFSDELDPVIDEYRELEALGPAEHQAVLRLLTEHEVVTKEFCERELGGDGARSLEPIENFIRRAKEMSPIS